MGSTLLGGWKQATWMTLALVLAHGVAAAEPPPEPAWEAEVLGVGWLSSLKADLDVGPATVSLDESIIDLVPLLTWAVAGEVGARYGDFVFGVNGLGQQIHISESTPAQTFHLNPLGGPVGGIDASVGPNKASIRSTEVMAEAFAGWRALSIPFSTLFTSLPQDDPRRFHLDLLGGARYWYWRTEVRLSIPPATLSFAKPPSLDRLPGILLGRVKFPRGISVGGSNAVLETTASWTDAIIGFRADADLTRTVSAHLRADIGGFGFGDSSDFTWQVMPGVQWRFSDHWSFRADYRVIGFDRNIVSNAILYGFQLGVGYRF